MLNLTSERMLRNDTPSHEEYAEDLDDTMDALLGSGFQEAVAETQQQRTNLLLQQQLDCGIVENNQQQNEQPDQRQVLQQDENAVLSMSLVHAGAEVRLPVAHARDPLQDLMLSVLDINPANLSDELKVGLLEVKLQVSKRGKGQHT